MSQGPRVSIVVPVYNRPEYLGQALESVLAQTYESWQLIVVDDASTDPAPYALAESFRDRAPERFNLIRLERNRGVAGARMVAMEQLGDSDLVTFLDSDDYLREDYLEVSVGLFDQARERGCEVGVVACNAQILEPGGMAAETFAERWGWTDPIDYDAMLERNYILARAMFSRAAYEEVGGLDPRCLCWDDYDLWMRMMEAGYEVIATEEPISVYRYHPGSMSRDEDYFSSGGVAAYGQILARGALTPRQRRTAKMQLRHYRALRERARVYDAVKRRRPVEVARRALLAVPYGTQAFLQSPSRWREWGRALLPGKRRSA